MHPFRFSAWWVLTGLCAALSPWGPASAAAPAEAPKPAASGPAPMMMMKQDPLSADALGIAAPRTDAELPGALKAYVDQLAAKEAFSGAVLVARGPKVLATGVWGMADRSWNIPNRLDTRFNLGSMNKMFTAVRIMQLVEAGKLSLEDPISKYLGADWLRPDVSKQTTVRHLMTHTSGFGNYFGETFRRSSRTLFRTVEDFKPLVLENKQAFAPGTAWEYGNINYVLLGAIIEKVTGQSYFDQIRQYVYAPAGMKNTDCYDLDTAVPNLAVGYVREEGPRGVVWRTNLFEHVVRGGPAGGGFSTVEDLHRFALALRGAKLVSAKTVEQMFTPVDAPGSRGYGLGFQIFSKDRVVGHTGGFVGIGAGLEMFQDNDVAVVVLTNQDRTSLRVGYQLRSWMAKLGK